jgi:hypothetical protein
MKRPFRQNIRVNAGLLRSFLRCSVKKLSRFPIAGYQADATPEGQQHFSTCPPARKYFQQLNGDDLRREPLEWRKAALDRLLARAGSGVQLNEHLEAEGPTVFEHACRMGLEGIVSKRKGSMYSSGRSPHWVKAKNPQAPAVTRLAEEDWGWSSGTRRRPPRRQGV